jgi:beta-fructofuranosidase
MLLFISHNLGTQYYLGTYKNGKFTPEKHARMNWPGGTFFAPEQLVDDKGRNIIWGWVLERNPEIIEWTPKWDEENENSQEFPEHSWSGIMSMPRVVSLSDAGEVLINPPIEIQQLRLEGIEESNLSVAANNEFALNISGKALEIKVEMQGGNEPYGVKVFTDPDGLEETVIKYDPKAKQLVIDFVKSAKDGPVKMRPNIMLEPELKVFWKMFLNRELLLNWQVEKICD